MLIFGSKTEQIARLGFAQVWIVQQQRCRHFIQLLLLRCQSAQQGQLGFFGYGSGQCGDRFRFDGIGDNLFWRRRCLGGAADQNG